MGRHRHHRHLSDLPWVVYDLERSLGEIHGALKEIKPVADEWLRRQRAAGVPFEAPERDAQPGFSSEE